jgi:hypothetical protein
MTTFAKTSCALIASLAVTAALSAQTSGGAGAAAQGFNKLKALDGEWIDVDGVFGTKGAVAVTYHVSGGGHTVVETFPLNQPEEMVTVYHMDGNDLVLTHYCSGGNQPHMRSKGLQGDALMFDFDGGSNIDPGKSSHMHSVKIEFLSADEIRGTWSNWSNGKADHTASFRVVRKK